MLYGGTIESVIKALYGKNLDKIVLIDETAASYLELAEEDGFPLLFNHTLKNNINSNYVHGSYVESLDMSDVIQIKGIYCTNKERTICDMIIRGKDIQAIVESICHYVEYGNNLKVLEDKVKELRIQDKFNWYYEQSLEYYDD